MEYKKLCMISILCIHTIITSFSQNNTNKIVNNSKASGSITGTLTFSNGDPVFYASVYIHRLKKHSFSDENGQFEIKNIPFGKYLLEIKTIEAEPQKIEIEVNESHTKLPVVVLKENSKLSLSEVIVWGKTETQKLKEKGFAVNVVDTKDVAFQSIQANELLDRTAGVRIRQSGGMGSQVQYNINGLSGNSVRIFIDGIPIRNYGTSFSLSSIPPAQIERIEVYKGVVPANLSEDALGGAINIVLKKSRGAKKNLVASYSYGSLNTHQGSIDGGYKDSKTGFTVTGSAFYNFTNNNYKVWGDQVYVSEPPTWTMKYIKAKRFHDDYESYGINANIGFSDVKWADRFSLGVLYSSMDKDVQNGGTMEVVYGNRRTGQDTKMTNLRYEKKDLFTRNLDLNSFVSYTHGNRWVVDTIPYIYNWSGNKTWNEETNDYYQWNNNGGEQGRATLAENKEITIAGRGNLSYSFHPRHRISINYLYNSFVRDVEDPLLPQAEQELTETRYLTKQILGGTYENNFFNSRLKTSLFFKYYIQNVRLKDPLTVNKELTYVEYDETINNNGYGIAVSYAITPVILIQSSFENALRMPESNELLGNTSESIDATYNLKPERSYNANLGFILGYFTLGQHQFRTDINFFIRDIRDMIMRGAENTKTGTYGYENLGKVISRGFDAEMGYNFNKKFFFIYNMSLFNARYNLRYDKNGKEYSYYNDRLRNAPYLTMNATAEYVFENAFSKGSQLSFNYNYGYVHEFYRNWESLGGAGKAIIPTQNIHDLGLIYSFPNKKLTLSFNAKNIFDEQVFDNWALQKPGRTFYGKISYKIF